MRYVDFDGQDFEEAVKTDEDEVELIPDGDGYAPANTGQSQQPLSGGSTSRATTIGGKGFSLIKYLKGLLNISNSSGEINTSSSEALDLAITYLGDGYVEVSPGRYVSADGTRQVRMADHDIACPYSAAHINFDMLSPYKTVHVYFYDN